MKLTLSSTARRKTFFAFSRSGGQPQIPSPVSRIAPKPSRLTKRSPPNKNVSSLLLVPAAVIIFGNPPVRTPATPARLTSKNVLRFIAGKIGCPYRLSTLNYQLSTGFDLSIVLIGSAFFPDFLLALDLQNFHSLPPSFDCDAIRATTVAMGIERGDTARFPQC